MTGEAIDWGRSRPTAGSRGSNCAPLTVTSMPVTSVTAESVVCSCASISALSPASEARTSVLRSTSASPSWTVTLPRSRVPGGKAVRTAGCSQPEGPRSNPATRAVARPSSGYHLTSGTRLEASATGNQREDAENVWEKFRSEMRMPFWRAAMRHCFSVSRTRVKLVVVGEGLCSVYRPSRST